MHGADIYPHITTADLVQQPSVTHSYIEAITSTTTLSSTTSIQGIMILTLVGLLMLTVISLRDWI